MPEYNNWCLNQYFSLAQTGVCTNSFLNREKIECVQRPEGYHTPLRLVDCDREFARRVLEMESYRLQQLIQ